MRSILTVFSVLIGLLFFIEDTSMITAIVPTHAITIILFIGFYLGILVSFVVLQIEIQTEKRLIKKNDELKFKSVLDNINSLTFSKRVGELIYFDFGNLSLIYNIAKASFFIFQGEECLVTSANIQDTETLKQLQSTIDYKFKAQMNDYYLVNGKPYSKNLFPKDTEEPPPITMTKYDWKEGGDDDEDEEIYYRSHEATGLNIDDILDKINTHGMSSLSKEELDFLKNQKG